uniref:Uncharacterized protein n=1 Tax=Arundo donax TaxID=35708 RepID=A0A0A8Y3Y3_ARUDO
MFTAVHLFICTQIIRSHT